MKEANVKINLDKLGSSTIQVLSYIDFTGIPGIYIKSGIIKRKKTGV